MTENYHLNLLLESKRGDKTTKVKNEEFVTYEIGKITEQFIIRMFES